MYAWNLRLKPKINKSHIYPSSASFCNFTKNIEKSDNIFLEIY